MIRATEVLPAGSWPPALAADRLVLTYEERHRRRLRFVAERGTTFLLDLMRTVVLRTGDGLKLEDGRIIRIEAAVEAVLAITVTEAQGLARLAWHIGNRHLPAQIDPHRILIREDPVIEDMLRGLGAQVRHELSAFTPERGAYDAGHSLLLRAGRHPHCDEHSDAADTIMNTDEHGHG